MAKDAAERAMSAESDRTESLVREARGFAAGIVVGKVGTGFDDSTRKALLRRIHPLERATSPFDPVPPSSVARTTTWVRPVLVGEVRFREWTGDGRLRHPVWRGLRDDKGPGEVTREP